MVYSPRYYIFSAAVASLATLMQETSAYSLFYAPVTTSNTTGQISEHFPAYGGDIADEDCAYSVTIDPTLPDLATILEVAVENINLLANMSSIPNEAISSFVGTSIITSSGSFEDAYTQATPALTKTGITTDSSSTGTKSGIPTTEDPNCPTNWNKRRKLRHTMTEREMQEKIEKRRRLEADTSQDMSSLQAYYGKTLVTTLKDLPTQGSMNPSPWPGPYWPTYQDSICVKWKNNEASPAQKYAQAFGLDVTTFMNTVSAHNGIDSMSSRPTCSSNRDCVSLGDGSECAIRDGKTSGYCIPTWYGICHAWTPAALLESEPNCDVQYNGVTFHPMDLKALISMVYDGASVQTVFMGTRFNGGTDTPDKYGRHSSAAFRDLNPGFFHILSANVLGLFNSTFIADVTAGAQVWNQPVRGFKVSEQTAMTLQQAAQTFYGLQQYPWNSAAASIVYMKTRFTWIEETYTDGGLVKSGQVDQYTTGAYYTYLLELDSNGNIIGGEWVYDSDGTHPDFAWIPKGKPAAGTVTSIGLSYDHITMLLQKSVNCQH